MEETVAPLQSCFIAMRPWLLSGLKPFSYWPDLFFPTVGPCISFSSTIVGYPFSSLPPKLIWFLCQQLQFGYLVSSFIMTRHQLVQILTFFSKAGFSSTLHTRMYICFSIVTVHAALINLLQASVFYLLHRDSTIYYFQHPG